MKKGKEWLKAQVKDEECELKSVYDNYVLYEKVLIAADVNDLIDQLEEPEPPVIPQFVADWIEHSKQKGYKLIGVMLYFYVLGIDSDDINKYINENYETFVRAWLDGYSVEKETLYNVKIGKGYFGGFNELKVTLILNDQPGCMDDVIIYSDKKDALKIAEEIGGVVEEVDQ